MGYRHLLDLYLKTELSHDNSPYPPTTPPPPFIFQNILNTEFNSVTPNLAFDSWHTSTKLLAILIALDISTACTATTHHFGTAPTLSTKVMMKKEHEEFCYYFDKMIDRSALGPVNG